MPTNSTSAGSPSKTQLGSPFHRRPAAVTTGHDHMEVHCCNVGNTMARLVYRNNSWSDSWEQSDESYFSYREPAVVAHSNGNIDRYSVWQFYELVVKRFTEDQWGTQYNMTVRTAVNPLGIALPNGDLATFVLHEDNSIIVTYRRSDDSWTDFQNLGGPFMSQPAGVAMPDGSGTLLLARRFDHSLEYLVVSSDSDSFNWKSLGSIRAFCNPEIAVAGNKVILAYRNIDNSIAIATLHTNSSNWSPKTEQLKGAKTSVQPALVAKGNSGHFLIFIRDLNNSLLMFDSGNKSEGWTLVADTSGVAEAPSAICRGDAVDVFVVLKDTSLKHIHFD